MSLLAATLLMTGLLAGGADAARGRVEPILEAVRPAPGGGLCFVELRSSPLLEVPVEIRGRLSYRDGVLMKEIITPAVERMELTAERFAFENAERRVEGALERMPVLQALRLGITGVLERDVALLERVFEIGIRRSDDGGWRIELVPRERSLARRIDSVWVAGNDGSVAEIGLVERGGGQQVMRIIGELEPDGSCPTEGSG